MTDGAAYTLHTMFKNNQTPQELKRTLEVPYRHLTSRTDMWTSGQWMTEKKGGSDVSRTETVAVKGENGKYRLFGYKWFTSATDSQMSLGLGKILP